MYDLTCDFGDFSSTTFTLRPEGQAYRRQFRMLLTHSHQWQDRMGVAGIPQRICPASQGRSDCNAGDFLG